MCAPLLAELVPGERPAELLVLATEIPGIRLGRATATYLSWHCAGAPLAFAVCDQGLLAAFATPRLAGWRDGRGPLLLAEYDPTVGHLLTATVGFGT